MPETIESDKVTVGYVIGTPYCGSTIMGMLMNTHPDIVSVGETAVSRRMRRIGRTATYPCSCGNELQACPFWNEIVKQVRETVSGFGFDCWSHVYTYDNRLADAIFYGYSGRRPIRWMREVAHSALPPLRKKLSIAKVANEAFYRAALAVGDGKVFFDSDKSLFRLRYLLHHDALDMRPIVLTKDVRQYAASGKRRGRPVADCAREWAQHYRLAAHLLSRHGNGNYIHVRHEDFCQTMPQTVGTLCDYLGARRVELSDRFSPRTQHVLGNKVRHSESLSIRSSTSWRESLDSREEAVALKEGEELMQQFGYQF
ncbi:hypothetical protein [Roseiconus lacunae]|uniref:Sulfotransferase n=1 Tax=Roseiconus lacunae TaxID=2605694 RepID=A0ABT7PQU8_9BACT|nr:hypothetical protein [Roseiconus lacunae]MDM4018846.1 hypothetical protein [Roseiconus lacunae]